MSASWAKPELEGGRLSRPGLGYVRCVANGWLLWFSFLIVCVCVCVCVTEAALALGNAGERWGPCHRSNTSQGGRSILNGKKVCVTHVHACMRGNQNLSQAHVCEGSLVCFAEARTPLCPHRLLVSLGISVTLWGFDVMGI